MPLASGGRPSTVDAPPSTQLANLALTPGGPSQGEPMVEAPHPSSQAVGSLNSQGIKKKSTQRKRRTWMELAAALMDPNDPYKGPRKRESSRSQSSQRSEASHVTASTTSNTAGTQSFGKVDYELICTYLEDEENFQQLFNTGSQTAVGPGQISRARAYERLAKYMNAKDFEQRTGAGIEETEGHHSLVQKLEVICLCFERMDALFKDKANITAMAVFDSIGDLGINAALDHSDVEEGLRDEALIDGTQNLESGSQVELTPRAIQSHTDALSGALERLEEEVSSPSHLEDGRGSSKINPAVIQSSQTSASSKASPTFPTTTHGSALNIYPTVSQSKGHKFTVQFFKQQWAAQRSFQGDHNEEELTRRAKLVSLYKQEETLEHMRARLQSPEIFLKSPDQICQLMDSIVKHSETLRIEREEIAGSSAVETGDPEEQKLRLLLWDAKAELFVQAVQLNAERQPLINSMGSRIGNRGKEKIIEAMKARQPAVKKVIDAFNQLYTKYKAKYPNQQLSDAEDHPLTYQAFSKWPMDHRFWNNGLYYHSSAPWSIDPDVRTAKGWAVAHHTKIKTTIDYISTRVDQLQNTQNLDTDWIDNIMLGDLTRKAKMKVICSELQLRLKEHEELICDWSDNLVWLWLRCQPINN
ncbi:hypothetical protein PtB15_4B472 [Puccinia triticina]|nr:hypothetical protein PtB15_4B472 [Puccinia triticina]